MVFVLFYFISIVTAQTDPNTPAGKNEWNISSSMGENNVLNSSIDVPKLNDQAGIRLAFDHIFISKKNDSILISEAVVFRNEGPQIHYSPDNHTFFAISTPPGIRDLKTQAMECCLVEEEGMVYMDPMKPVKNGETFEMEISYVIPAYGKEYLFNKSAIYNTTSLSIFINKKSGLNINGPFETLILSGIEYDVVTFNEIRAGEITSLPIKMTQGSGTQYAVLALIFLFGLVYHFRGKLRFRKKKVQTLEDLEFEKKRIFQTIHGFTKHAGSEESEEYRKLMEEYRNKAIQISYDIDKLKNKKGF